LRRMLKERHRDFQGDVLDWHARSAEIGCRGARRDVDGSSPFVESPRAGREP
jgi:hypothetical protein